jgi:hypothetical protein
MMKFPIAACRTMMTIPLYCTTSTSKIMKVTNFTKTFTGCAMAYVVSCQPVAAVAQVQSQASLGRICGG